MKDVATLVHFFADRAFAQRMLSDGFTHVSCVACGQYVNKKRIVSMVAFHRYEGGAPYERVPTWQVVNKKVDDVRNPIKEIPPHEEWYSLGGFAELLQLYRIEMSDQVLLADVCANWPDVLPDEVIEEDLSCTVA